MLAIRWLYDQAVAAEPAAWRAGGEASCWLCGVACPQGEPSQPVAKAVSDTFNDHALACCPASDWLCPSCSWYLSDSRAYRQASWILTPTTATRWERETWRDDLDAFFQGTPAFGDERILAITTSYKKHILLAALPSYGSSSLIIQFEQQIVHLTVAEWYALTAPFDALRRLGHRKSEIVSGALHPLALARHGRIQRALELSQQLDEWRGSQALELLAYVSPAGDMAEEEGTSGPDDIGGSSSSAAGDLQGDSAGLQEQIPHDPVGAGAKHGRRGGAQDQRSGNVYQPGLFEA